MRIGYLQFEPVFGKPETNMQTIARLLEKEEFDLMVLPELAQSGYVFSSKNELEELAEEIPSGTFCSFLKKISADKKAFIVSGICERSRHNFYNSSILVSPDGKIETYRKLHLFYEEKLWFSPGNIPLIAHEIRSEQWGTVRIGMMICFDWRFPEVTRTLALKGAHIICHPSNLVMPHCQDAMITRALENHVFTVTANRTGRDVKPDKQMQFTGKSIIVAPGGVVLKKGNENTEEVSIVTIDPILAENKNVNEFNDAFKDRREEFYE
ncbi:MAG: acyltransferase [Phycisphaerae bacterium]|nr:acyltransferase [Phycisphaerae bacterium]